MTRNIENKSERLLTRKELGRRWSKSERTLKRWEIAGRLRPLAIGSRTIRYRLSDIEEIEREAEVS